VPDLEAAWRIVLIYARRWQIELAWRYGKITPIRGFFRLLFRADSGAED
jgi:hypothetical protein